MGPRTVTFVALLRGINVGGKNKLAMKDLVAIFEDSGCTDVRNYIQSGNVVFRANKDAGDRTASLVRKAIAQDHGLQVPVVVRSASEMVEVAQSNPFLEDGSGAAEHLHVMFLADTPEKAHVATLDHARSHPDVFVPRGREIFLLLPNGVARSKLTNAYFDSALRTVSTSRNWKTVLTLAGMAGG